MVVVVVVVVVEVVVVAVAVAVAVVGLRAQQLWKIQRVLLIPDFRNVVSSERQIRNHQHAIGITTIVDELADLSRSTLG